MILPVLIGYLVGSVPFALFISRAVKGVDIRQIGDGNPGAANVARHIGKLWGVLVWLADTLKGMFPLAAAKQFFGIQDFFVLALVGAAAVAGHCWPVFLRCKGGKGAATSGGVVLYILPGLFPLVLILWFFVQKINPRSPWLIGLSVIVFFLVLRLMYSDQWQCLVSAVFVLIVIGMLGNLKMLKEMINQN